MSDFVISLIRTWTPVLVGAVATWLLEVLGVAIDTEALTGTLVVVISGAWYAAVRWLEGKFPWAGWLIGAPKPPSY